MRTQNDLLKLLVSRLTTTGVPYMISGSLGSTFHGKPRATRDIDIIVDAPIETLLSLGECFDDDFYVSDRAIRDAVTHETSFNIIDLESGFKCDIIVKKRRPFSEVEFARRRTVVFHDTEVVMVSPEDSILSKLEWAMMSGSERQYEDARNVAELQWEALDVDYLHVWAENLGVAGLLERLLEEIDIPKNS